MAYAYFDASYAPCGFLIVKDSANPYSENPSDSALIQSDWDFPGVASRMGFVPCACGATDGTVDCAHRTASEMIAAAYDFIRGHAGESFAGLDDYLA